MRHMLSDKDLSKRTAVCSVCGPVKLRIVSKKSGRNSAQCINKARAAARRYARRARPWIKYKQKRKNLFNQIKLDRGCMNCGYNKYAVALDFHHRDPSSKSFNIAWMINYRSPIPVIMAEIEKCDVLCAICHRLVTAGILL